MKHFSYQSEKEKAVVFYNANLFSEPYLKIGFEFSPGRPFIILLFQEEKLIFPQKLLTQIGIRSFQLLHGKVAVFAE